MATVQAEDHLVSNLIEIGDVGAEFLIVDFKLISKLDFYELVEFLGTLSAIRSAIENTHKHEKRNVNFPII